MAGRKSIQAETLGRTRQYAERRDVEAAAEDMSDSFLACRDMAHPWKPWTVQWFPKDRTYERVLRCPRCKTERVQELSQQGGVVSNRYRYPEGYQLHLGYVAGDAKEALRLASLVRQMSDQVMSRRLKVV